MVNINIRLRAFHFDSIIALILILVSQFYKQIILECAKLGSDQGNAKMSEVILLRRPIPY